MSKSIALVSLGCDKNRVDAERMTYTLEQAGYTVGSDPASADCAMPERMERSSMETAGLRLPAKASTRASASAPPQERRNSRRRKRKVFIPHLQPV